MSDSTQDKNEKRPRGRPSKGQTKSNSERQREFREKMRDQGYDRIHVWLPVSMIEQLAASAKAHGRTLNEEAELVIEAGIKAGIKP